VERPGLARDHDPVSLLLPSKLKPKSMEIAFKDKLKKVIPGGYIWAN
jgi:hypothetical protein